MTVYDGPPGKSAVTHVKTLAFDGKLSAVLVRIETGRTHQIRVHLKERRTPIAGDEAYGNSDWNKKQRKAVIMLDKDNNIIMEFNSICQAAIYTGHINHRIGIKRVLGKNNCFAYNYKWILKK